MATIRIPGPESVPNVPVARDLDRNVRASAATFGAGIGHEVAQFGDTLAAIGTRLARERQSAEDGVYSNTFATEYDPRARKEYLEAQKQFPDGGEGFTANLNERLDRAAKETHASLAQRGLRASAGTMARVASHESSQRRNYLVSGVTWEHNQKVAALNAQLDTNVDKIEERALATGDVDSGLRDIDGVVAAQRAILPADKLKERSDGYRDRVILAAINGAIQNGDLDRARELNGKYYGRVPGDATEGGKPPQTPDAGKALRIAQRIDAAAGVERRAMQGDIKDDLASVTDTGKGLPHLTPERVTRVLGREGADQWLRARQEGLTFWEATRDFENLPTDKIYEAAETLAPKAGVQGYTSQRALYDAAIKKADAIAKLRFEDPAAAVSNDPEVRAAQPGANFNDPASVKRLVTARLAAQERLNIPEGDRSPITRGEGLGLTAEMRTMLPGQERDILGRIAERFQTTFGDLADEAFEFALRARRIDAETAKVASRFAKKLGLGQMPTREDAQQVDQTSEVDAADRAIGATPAPPYAAPGSEPEMAPPPFEQRAKEQGRVPPSRAISYLRNNPHTAEQFDKEFGAGSAKKILEGYSAATPQRFLGADDENRITSGGWPSGQVGPGQFRQIGIEMARQSEEAQDPFEAMEQFMAANRIDPEAFDAWLRSRPQSQNVVDRRKEKPRRPKPPSARN